jgi:hypothetical protein
MRVLSPMKAHSFNYTLENGTLTYQYTMLLLNFGTHEFVESPKPKCKQLRSNMHYSKIEKSISRYLGKGRYIITSLKKGGKLSWGLTGSI